MGTSVELGQTHLGTPFQVPAWVRKFSRPQLLEELIGELPAVQSAENRRKVSPILVTLTSRNDSDFENSNVSLKENKPNGVYPNSERFRLLGSKE